MTDKAPAFRNVAVRGCPSPKACIRRNDPDGTGYQLDMPKKGAIPVLDQNFKPIGEIPPEISAAVIPWMQQGWVFTCTKKKRIMCAIIVDLEPVPPTKFEKTTDIHELFGIDKTVDAPKQPDKVDG